MEIAEFDPLVTLYEEQPVTIHYQDQNGKNRRYTPDFQIHYQVSPLHAPSIALIEIKYRSTLKEDWLELKPKFQAALRYTSQLGQKFFVLTDREIRTDYHHNVRTLLRFQNKKPDENRCEIIMKALEELGGSVMATKIIDHVVASDQERGYYLATLWQLLSQRIILADLTTILSPNSLLRKASSISHTVADTIYAPTITSARHRRFLRR